MENQEQHLFEKAAEYAAKEYNGDQKKVAAFMEGFVKEAFNWGEAGSAAARGGAKGMNYVGQHVLPDFSKAIGKGLGTLLVAGGTLAAAKGVMSMNDNALHEKFVHAFNQAVSSNQVLRDKKRDKLMGFAETIYKFAPNVAGDPNVLSTLLVSAAQYEAIDPNTIKLLGELEQRYQTNNSFNPRNFI